MRIWPLLLLFACSSGTTYEPCEQASECAGDDACHRLRFFRSDGSEGDGAFCSHSCAGDVDCPSGGSCVSIVGDGAETAFCAANCEGDAECPAPLRCTAVTGVSAGRLCLP